MGKVYDGIIGVAIGDALGVPVDFVPRQELARSPVTGMQGYGTHNQPAGTWSDDTSLTLAFMDSIVHRQLTMMISWINFQDGSFMVHIRQQKKPLTWEAQQTGRS